MPFLTHRFYNLVGDLCSTFNTKTMKPQLSPWLFFSGNCREAMNFYQQVLGGKLSFSTYSEGPDAQREDLKHMADKIMYSEIAGPVSLFACDSPYIKPGEGKGQHVGILRSSDAAYITACYEKLSVDAKQVTMPLAKQFWGDTFAMLTDKFGTDWMISITPAS